MEKRYISKWEADKTKEEKITLALKPVEVYGLAWEIGKEHLLSQWFNEILEKTEKKLQKYGDVENYELYEVLFVREIARSIPQSWHKELLLRFVNEYAKKHDITFGDDDE